MTYSGILATAVSTMALAAAAPATAELSFSGDIAVGLTAADTFSSDDSQSLSPNGVDLSGTVRAQTGAWVGFADFDYTDRDTPAGAFDSNAPEGARSLGLHLGHQFDGVYVGIFGGKNWFQGDDSASGNGYLDGEVYGLEMEYDLGNDSSIFAQFGDADMVGDQGDTAFRGEYVRAGFATTRGKLTIAADVEYGRSDAIFEDSSDWGDYTAYGVDFEYRFHPRVIGTLGLSRMDITANSEDNGEDNMVSIGIKVPFGADYERNNLTTSYRPGLAAAWAEVLD